MAMLLPFAVLYAVSFTLLFACVNARAYAVGVILAVIASWWMLSDVARADGPAAMFALMGVAQIVLGFLSGGLARGLLLARGRKGSSLRANLVVGSIFLIGMPALLFGWNQWRAAAQKRKWEPPSLACRSRHHDVELGRSVLKLPLLKSIRVGAGRQFDPQWSFEIPSSAREFCDWTDRTRPTITNLTIDFARTSPNDPAFRSAPCDKPQKPAWWPALCRPRGYPSWPVQDIKLFDPQRYDHSRMLATELDTEGYLARYAPQLTWVRKGRYEVLDGGTLYYRTGKDATFYHAQCHGIGRQGDRGEEMRCRVAYLLSPRLALSYNFRTTRSAFEADAERIDRDVRAIVASLGAPTAF